MPSHNEKAQKAERVAEAALKLIDKVGLGRLTVAQVARTSKISRPWIYKYVGSSQDELIDFAVAHFGRVMSAMDGRSNPSSGEEWVAATLRGTGAFLDLVEKRPWLVSIYFRYRGTDTVPGRRIDRLEDEYLRIFSSEIQKSMGLGLKYAHFLSSSIMAVRLGLAHQWVTTPKRDAIHREKLLQLVEAVLRRMVHQ